MKKRGSKLLVLAMSLLLLGGMVLSASAASGNANNSQTSWLGQGIRVGQQQAQSALQVVADLTGLSITDIQSQRVEGKSLVTIADENGVSEQTVIDNAIAERIATLEQLKADNKITEAQYQNCISNMEARITANIERTAVGSGNCGQGMGRGQGAGQGQGMGRGCGQNQANCIYNTQVSGN